MAKEAERLLDGTGWPPEPLRLASIASVDDTANGGEIQEAETLPAFLADEDEDENAGEDKSDEPAVIAAE